MSWEQAYLQSTQLIPQKPSYAFLTELMQAHLQTFPFENISKLIKYKNRQLHQGVIPTPEEFVKQYQQYCFGGTCYAQNRTLYHILKYLGFKVRYVMLGQEHMALLVNLPEFPEEDLYVDCGAAAPFFKPVRFMKEGADISFGEDLIRFTPQDSIQEEFLYQRYYKGKPSGKGWRFNLKHEVDYADFNQVIEAANQPGTPFMRILRLQLWDLQNSRSISLLNNRCVFRYNNGVEEQHQFINIGEMESFVKDVFPLPKLPIKEAIEALITFDIDIFNPEG